MRRLDAKRGIRGLLGVCLCAWPLGAHASPTDPVLVVTAARAVVGASAVLVRIDGSFPSRDLVQLAYPLQVLIRETQTGAGYVRYDLAGEPVTGVAPELADGLDAAEAPGLLVQGDPSPDARVVSLGLHRLEVMLPAGFPAGPAEVQLFVVDGPLPILSNPVPFVVDGAGGP